MTAKKYFVLTALYLVASSLVAGCSGAGEQGDKGAWAQRGKGQENYQTKNYSKIMGIGKTITGAST